VKPPEPKPASPEVVAQGLPRKVGGFPVLTPSEWERRMIAARIRRAIRNRLWQIQKAEELTTLGVLRSTASGAENGPLPTTGDEQDE
jgi:hypothetical protein